MSWIKDWQQQRRERKIFEALFLLASIKPEPNCFWCSDIPVDCECECGPDCD